MERLLSRRRFLIASAASAGIGAIGALDASLGTPPVEEERSTATPTKIAFPTPKSVRSKDQAVVLPKPAPALEATPTPESNFALGEFKTPSGQTELVQVRGFGNEPYSYQICTPGSKEVLTVPIQDVEITKGEPIKMKPNPHFGIRADYPESIGVIERLGLGAIRIDGADFDLSSADGDAIKARDTLRAAMKAALEICYVYHPLQPLPSRELSKVIRSISDEVDGYPKFDWEIGNEQDLSKYWQNGDLESFTEFFKNATDEILSFNPRANIIIGALSRASFYKSFIGDLMDSKVLLQNFRIAAHVYNSVEYLDHQVLAIKQAMAQYGLRLPVVITELGCKKKNEKDRTKGERLVTMLEKALWVYGIDLSLIHELINAEGWGVTNGDNPNKIDQDGRLVQYLTQFVY